MKGLEFGSSLQCSNGHRLSQSANHFQAGTLALILPENKPKTRPVLDALCWIRSRVPVIWVETRVA
jgi:hypothetical protein